MEFASNPAWLSWIDVETTGLDGDRCKILEVALVVTDKNLVSRVRYSRVIYHTDLRWGKNDEWARKTHHESGLLDEVGDPTKSLPLSEVEDELVHALKEVGRHPLAGSSVHFDRKFLSKHMPRVIEHLDYRHVDVSTLVEVAKRWAPDLAEKKPKKRALHRAMPDIEDSIETMKFFKENLFEKQGS